MGFLLNLGIALITVLTIVIVWLYWFYQNKFKYWESKGVEYSKPSFIFGNLLGLGRTKAMAEIIKDLYNVHKNLRYFGIWRFFLPVLVVNDPELIKNILITDFEHFQDRKVHFNEKKDPLSASLLALKGKKWRNIRVKLTPAFTSGKIKMMFPLMKECGEMLDELLHETAEKNEMIEAKDVMGRYTTDTSASAAFGITSNSLKNPDSIFREIEKKVFAPSWRTMIAFFLPDLATLLQLTLTPRDVSKFFLGAFKETMDYREMNDVKRNDILQLLIQLKNKGLIDDVDSETKGTGAKFTFEQAAAQAYNIFVGGIATSSSTLQFAMLELALNHDIQNKLRREIRRVLAKHNNEVTYEAVQAMEYMGRVMDETLRKYPTTPMTTRLCTKDYKVPDSNLVVEKGNMVLIPIYGLHSDERYYPNPEVFDPERFSEEEKQTRHKYVYLPFGEGPRNCIGSRFAQMQIRVALVYMLNKYQLDISPEHTIRPLVFDPKLPTLVFKGDMNLRVSLVKE